MLLCKQSSLWGSCDPMLAKYSLRLRSKTNGFFTKFSASDSRKAEYCVAQEAISWTSCRGSQYSRYQKSVDGTVDGRGASL